MQQVRVSTKALASPLSTHDRDQGRIQDLPGGMASAKLKPITGVWGRSPQRGSRGRAPPPWSQRAETPLKLKAFCPFSYKRGVKRSGIKWNDLHYNMLRTATTTVPTFGQRGGGSGLPVRLCLDPPVTVTFLHQFLHNKGLVLLQCIAATANQKDGCWFPTSCWNQLFQLSRVFLVCSCAQIV